MMDAQMTMKSHDVLRALQQIEVAHQSARQARDALRTVLELVPDTHPGWLALTRDTEAIELRLRCAIEALAVIFTEDVAPIARSATDEMLKLARVSSSA
jgi:hypothetical protein